MPNIKSAKKRVLVAEARRLRNISTKSAVKTIVKKFENFLAAGKTDDAQTSLRKAISFLDKSASKGIIHKNAAARKKSRLTKKLNLI
jgi:small subunit ribosomal protein S20